MLGAILSGQTALAFELCLLVYQAVWMVGFRVLRDKCQWLTCFLPLL